MGAHTEMLMQISPLLSRLYSLSDAVYSHFKTLYT